MKARKLLATIIALALMASFVTVVPASAGPVEGAKFTPVAGLVAPVAAGTEVGTFSATGGTGHVLTYTLVEDDGDPIEDNGLFTLTDGVLKLTEANAGGGAFTVVVLIKDTYTDDGSEVVDETTLTVQVTIAEPYIYVTKKGTTLAKEGFTYIAIDGGVASTVTQIVAANAANLALNLSTEKLENGTYTGGVLDADSAFEIAGWAVNDKWKLGAPADKDIAAWFSKGGVIKLTDKMSAKAKDGPSLGVAGKAASGDDPPEEGEPCGTVIEFNTIVKRDKTPKLVIDYALKADDTGKTNGAWTLREKDKATAYEHLDKLQISDPKDDKKIAADDEWGPFPVAAGVAVEDLGDNGKVGGKVLYFVKVKPYAGTGTDIDKFYPATAAVKVSASALSKAPKFKPDYKNMVFKPKSGVAVSVANAVVGSDIVYTLYAKAPVTGRSVAIPAKGSEPTLDSITLSAISMSGQVPNISATGSLVRAVVLFNYADKKPASQKQVIVLAPPAANLVGDAGITWGGKKIVIPKALEGRDTLPTATDNKWGKPSAGVAPKTSGVSYFFVRTKSTAKAGKPDAENVMGSTGAVASAVAKIQVTWGKDADDKPVATKIRVYIDGVTDILDAALAAIAAADLGETQSAAKTAIETAAQVTGVDTDGVAWKQVGDPATDDLTYTAATATAAGSAKGTLLITIDSVDYELAFSLVLPILEEEEGE
ncbi:MAG: hypothetical protein LBI44_00005 [Oscillospiraceae bacterium]|jgi:hypothetical protein|nr:hypothetical protein [Oscillospiraceae bacterium]